MHVFNTKTILSSIKTFKNQDWLMLALCGVVLFMVIAMPNYSALLRAYFYFVTAHFVFKLEWLFIILYVILLREIPAFHKLIRQYWLTALIMFAWVLLMSYSFFNSPMELTQHSKAWSRYYQTLTHVLFFIFVWDFFNRYKPDYKWLVYTIALSSMVIVAYYFYEWFFDPPYKPNTWRSAPPHNSNIRHTGFQLAAALCFFLAFFIGKIKKAPVTLLNIFILTVLWGFIFWTGGRGTILSILITLLLLLAIFVYKNSPIKPFYSIVLTTACIGVLLGEWLALSDWYGLSSAFHRSVDSESLQQLSNSRIFFWKMTAPSLKDNFWFGLGPQSYFYLSYGYYSVQPHTVILQFLFEWGLIGSLLFTSLLIKALWSGVKHHLLDKSTPANPYALGAFAVISTLSINALVDGTYYHPQPSVYLAIAFAIWILPASGSQQYEKNTVL